VHGTDTSSRAAGKLALAIANMTVHVLRVHTGRGPTRSRSYLNDDLISVVLRGTLTQAEHALVADGKSELVLSNRRAFQGIMQADLVAAVEALTGRTVIAVFSDHTIDPDVALESFLLAPQDAATRRRGGHLGAEND
jgi:uncharacterized protein YbcI